MTVVQEAQSAFVGALLLCPGKAATVEAIARPEDFPDKRLGVLVGTVYKLARDPAPVDIVSIVTQLRTDGKLDWFGGESGIMELMSAVTSTAHIAHHASIIRRDSTRRAIMAVCEDGLSQARGLSVNKSAALDALLAGLESAIFSVGRQVLGGAVGGSIEDLMTEVFTALDRPQHERQKGWKIGYHAIDHMTAGLRPGELTLIAARPGVGKTVFALNVAANLCSGGAKVLFVSMEMSTEQIAQRVLSRESHVSGYHLRSGYLDAADRRDMVGAAGRMSGWKLQIFEDYGTSVGRLGSMARRASSDMGGVDFIVVDYLQLMADQASSKRGRVEEVSTISRGLKSLARELRVNVIALSQLSRAGVDGEPGLHHLRDSGALEQDADQVIMLWTEEIDHTGHGGLRWSVAKNRHGSTGRCTLPLLFDRACFHLTDFDPPDPEMIPLSLMGEDQ